MTLERKKYLATTSKEEQAIRLELSIQKNRIRYLKEWLEYPIHTNDKCTMLRLMQDARFIIKALKKQLPAPTKIYKMPFNNDVCMCFVCGWNNSIEQDYCGHCGQKLR